MAERILRSPGITTRELDLSAPGRVRPQGIPAGIIGTSQKGPAFVPVTFATTNDFANIFGATEGKHYGAMAVNEWMRNARSGLYLRVLGVGNGQKASSLGYTTNAGFVLNEDRRDNTDTTLPTDMVPGVPGVNPYAGARLPSQISLATTAAGQVGAAGALETTQLTVSHPTGWSGAAEYDGLYIIAELSDGAEVSALNGTAPSVTKKAFWLSAQAIAGNGGDRDVSGLEVKDGEFTIATLVGVDEVTLVDISAAASTDDIATAISTVLANAGFTSNPTASVVDFTSPEGAVNATSAATTSGQDPVASYLSPARILEGENIVAAEDSVFTLTLSSGTEAMYDGSTIVVTEADSTETTLTVGTEIDGSALIQDTNATSIATALTFNTVTGANTGANVNGDNEITITITAGASLPSVALSENAPQAPAGSTWFLGQLMETSDNDVDYLGGTGEHSVLRGVVMFASGVVPGILDIDATIDPDLAADGGDMPNAAWGEYGSGKNQGNSDYLGKIDSDQNFIIALNGFTNNSSYDNVLTGSFDPLSPIYFPKVLNTDPTKLQEKGHYLYASYDVPEGLAIPTSQSNDDQAILKNGAWAPTDVSTDGSQFALSDDGNTDYQPTYEDFRSKFSHAFTPWIMSQKLGNATKKLFRFHMLDAGVGGHNNVKISIVNISRSTDTRSDYGTFDVVVRSATDTDLAPEILQTFSRCSLNPASDRYIARIIGDQNTFFEFEKDLGKQKLVTEGLYPNRSQFVRVEVVDQIESGMMEATALPCGFAGKHHLVLDGKSLTSDKAIELKEAPLPLRQNVSVGSGTTKVVDSRFYWGVQYQDVRTVTQRNKETGLISLVSNLTKWFPSHGEYAAWVGDNKGVTDADASLDADDYNNNAFSLENIWVKCLAGDTNLAVDPTMWQEAIYIRNKNATGVNANSAAYTEADGTDKTGANGYRYLDVAKDFGSSASKKYYKFTVPFQGGFDGFDIFDQDKAEMNNISAFREMSSGGISAYGGPQGPTTAAFRKGLDILAEKSDVDVQILATPGMRSAGITDYAIDKTEDRFDALFILDVDAYDHDQKLVVSSSQETSVSYTAQALADRNLDTSFAAAYFPDVVIRDGANNVVVPPSVAVLGALSLNDKVAHPWFAPAGFARGALASTIETQVKLNRANMDVLYDSDINPITAFPHSAESVVVFGQKTMLQAQSALDRVNVRRLLIDVRRKVRKVANQILFEPNRETTLARFSALVNPILGRIQQQQGVDRYKVVIDTTTTTQQDVENNTIRGKIFLQPTRSIEFISLDFVVTNQGAEI